MAPRGHEAGRRIDALEVTCLCSAIFDNVQKNTEIYVFEICGACDRIQFGYVLEQLRVNYGILGFICLLTAHNSFKNALSGLT